MKQAEGYSMMAACIMFFGALFLFAVSLLGLLILWWLQ